ncbi:hypothetical protein [Parasulfitobacter algicola]|uniref:Lipoprotein n=1 Tax=Parasulfitobacter algicola TaxID=2614809 RepID=A0ABX2ISV6_9RHOB|nr:hypothetical protein [Sulfitobacter algicola]NSX54160.1 hypothetical protein [Sulfitobacter algicola]
MRWIIALTAFALVACDLPEPSETMISDRSNTSASYRAGFDDGCHSGRQAAGDLFEQFRKDQTRFNSDRDYAQGWSDAFRQCETQSEAQMRQMRSAATINAIKSREPDKFDRVLRNIDYSGLEGL